MTITLPADLAEALRVFARDNGISYQQACIEILTYFLKVKP